MTPASIRARIAIREVEASLLDAFKNLGNEAS